MSEPCRFAAEPHHTCMRNDGSPVGAGGVCFYEAVAQSREANEAAGVAPVTDPSVYRTIAGAAVAQRQERAS